MENMLQGLPKVVVYLNDILGAGSGLNDYLSNFNSSIRAPGKSRTDIKKVKVCLCDYSSLEYLGHVIDATGLHPASS